MTITNANFDLEAIEKRTLKTMERMQALRSKVDAFSSLPEAALWENANPESWREKQATVGVLATENEDIRSLKELIVYGLKGLSAYSKHANVLGKDNPELDAFLQSALAKTLEEDIALHELVQLTLDTGSAGVKAMALLDEANTSAYGYPEISEVRIDVGTRPGILVSGHDLRDMEMLLEQSKDAGIDIYTHSEMLPANYYPALKKYDHFYGNCGNAWWMQKEEFESFRGPILMTTNCIVPPEASYQNKLFTTGMAGYPGCRHIPGEIGEVKDFSEIIELAKTCEPPLPIDEGQ